ncbi:c-type cytochrome (plasmid) [Pedobacter sp. BS3]|uniref:cbb3-type cytochrome c oxidase N-terminal domain-containing protein n=1 Tax=Pedobacter sp. BS3 TaxID=2567937 RepID=UPI0011EDED9E|nr:cbb3-type cytochrome c oxidase N-terminal domain-containing protein [Pedobacter sp. BS3]TZF85636.1 c-type cytochrome [Pedobacter sp. BS3]
MKPLRFFAILLPAVSTVSAFAQDAAAPATPDASSNIPYSQITFVAFILAILILLIAILVLLRAIKILSKELLNPTPLPAPVSEEMVEWSAWAKKKKNKPGIMSKILGLRPLSEEKELLMEHEFDGITELDNPTPRWFMWLFYATIFFGVAYLFNYHILGWGKLQDEEYVAEMQKAEKDKAAHLTQSADNVDENTVKENTDAAVISAGEAIFKQNCVACHGDKGQGIVGPNLTDEYWLHGGKINNIFKTIKYGIPEKGMISWEKTLTAKQISDVANYIKSLKGTNPPNPKAPQGDKEG